jgi:2-(1,2-epoxy-1,2-dihydrophenyl)acetyl-CoA isomerase
MIDTHRDGDVAVVTLARTEALNAFYPAMLEALADALRDAVQVQKARAVVLTAAGRTFSVGGDVRWFEAQARQGSEALAQAIADVMGGVGPAVMRLVHESPVPVVCAVNGPCVGAAVALALATDVVLCARSAYFLVPQVTGLGLVPDGGATWALARALGRPRAFAMALLGERIPAAQAEQWGMVWKCCDDAELMPEALASARRLAVLPGGAVTGTRRLLDQAAHTALDSQLIAELGAQQPLIRSDFFRAACAKFTRGAR